MAYVSSGFLQDLPQNGQINMTNTPSQAFAYKNEIKMVFLRRSDRTTVAPQQFRQAVRD
jgi:hypothetical protein